MKLYRQVEIYNSGTDYYKSDGGGEGGELFDFVPLQNDL